MASDVPRFATFEQFWPFYVSQHSKSATRALHFAGTTCGLLCLARAIATGRSLYLLWGLVSSYGLAWIGHFVFEKNRPATFQHPLWSLRGDFRMYALMWRGEMAGEAQRLMLSPSPTGIGSG